MGTDISTIEEVRDENGLWQMVSPTHPAYAQFKNEYDYFPFGSRSYSVYGFLGNIRNSANSPFITESRGLPDDSVYLNSIEKGSWFGDTTRASEIRNDGNNYGYSWVTLAELLAFNYDQAFENLRGSSLKRSPNGQVVSYHGNLELKPGEGEVMTLRNHLENTYFFEHVEGLRAFGEPENVRVIFWFN